jgi:hypothetical protein
MRGLSQAAIQAMYSSETDEAIILLLTVYSIADNTTPVLRLADNFTKRLTSYTTDTDVVYGVTSNSQDFIFFPMDITLPGESDDGSSNCTIAINYASKDLIEFIRTNLTSPAKILLQLVLTNNPSYIEAAFTNFYITGVTYSAQGVNLQLSMINYSTEPFPAYNFSPKYFPGLF